MSELILKDVSLNINKVQVATKKNLIIKGICSVTVSSDACYLKDILLLFSMSHMYSSNDIKIEGSLILDEKILPVSKMHFLLNQNMIFDGNDTVMNILHSINPTEAASIINKLQIYFPKKRVCRLSCTESRIFKIAINLATKPKIIYIKRINMPIAMKNNCIEQLKEHAILHGSVVLIETDHSDLFDSAIIIKNEKIMCLDSSQAHLFFKSLELNTFSPTHSEKDSPLNFPEVQFDEPFNEFINTLTPLDYKIFFKKYNTENLIDCKHKRVSLYNRILNPYIYKINFSEALKIGIKKYETSFQRFEQKISICKSIFPCIFCIFLIRFIQLFNDKTLIEYIPDLLSHIIYTWFNRNQLSILILYFFKTFVIKEFSLRNIFFLIKHFLRSEIPGTGYTLIFGSVFFSIIYHYSFIFEEELQILNYKMNILFTPGTFIMGIFIYIFLVHFTTFLLIGLVFNIKLMPVSVLSASFTNLFYCSFTGKRLRSSMLGILLAIFLHLAFADITQTRLSIMKYLYLLVFPCISTCNFYEGAINSISSIVYPSRIYFYLYCLVAYIFCCNRLSYL